MAVGSLPVKQKAAQPKLPSSRPFPFHLRAPEVAYASAECQRLVDSIPRPSRQSSIRWTGATG